MRNVGALAQFERQQIPPIKVPAVHARERPLTLNPLLDPACELCYLPIISPGWYDYSPNAYWGTLNGTAWTDNGRFGPAVESDAGNDHVALGIALNLMFVAGDFTIETWMMPTVFNVGRHLFNRGAPNADGYRFTMTGAGGLGFDTNQALAMQATTTAAGVVVLNLWNHLVVRRQGAGIQIFVNSVDVTAVPGVHINPVGNPGRTAFIGANAANNFRGFVDLLRVYSRYLGDQEILDLFNQGRPQWMG